ncbi:PhoH family protein [Hugonella massiliensis]|uniref:PhoH family protein n=1 Tax=Hugonella massiliensis TaxID=1720315 RepID=UPI00073E5548|nr:PhoH family protein [Hugonella massiliensis]
MTDSQQLSITAPDGVDMALVVGPRDANLEAIRKAFNARVTVRGNEVKIKGDPIETKALGSLFDDLMKSVEQGRVPDVAYVTHAIELLHTGAYAPAELRNDVILVHRGTAVRPKTAGQKAYVDAIRSHTITFAIGPAGTGKTYLAMALALSALKRREVGRIVLSRPVVEAGESLGFLPGTLDEKVDPYIRPLYDALFDMSDREWALQMIEDGTVEIAPLAFMRGRTLSDSFVVLDEAQNATHEQMKMFLTRLGFGSKMVVTGDVSQTDLPRGRSGLAQVHQVLDGIDDIAFCSFNGTDVVRHSLVAAIIAAYNREEEQASSRRKIDGDNR